MIQRYLKIALVGMAAAYVTLVAFNNLTDYNSNFMFVKHVLSMDTTFPDNAGMWRRLTADWIHHVAYALIIFTECVVAVVCWLGTYRLWASRHYAQSFEVSKGTAAAGLVLGIGLWFFGFVVVGAEWFLMWQSQIWNGTEVAARLTIILLGILIYLSLPEAPDQSVR